MRACLKGRKQRPWGLRPKQNGARAGRHSERNSFSFASPKGILEARVSYGSTLFFFLFVGKIIYKYFT